MAEQKIVMEFTEQEIFDLDAMVTEGYRLLRDDATEQQRAAALAIVHRIDKNRRALLAGERAPDAKPDSETEWGTRDRHGQVHSVGVENEAQARSMRSMTPVSREVGPWIEVTS
jgi:hypothetical protein